jgi:hypothetical protein
VLAISLQHERAKFFGLFLQIPAYDIVGQTTNDDKQRSKLQVVYRLGVKEAEYGFPYDKDKG